MEYILLLQNVTFEYKIENVCSTFWNYFCKYNSKKNNVLTLVWIMCFVGRYVTALNYFIQTSIIAYLGEGMENNSLS